MRKAKDFYVYRRRGGVYYIALRMGDEYVRSSLNTGDKREAYRLAEERAALLRRGGDTNVTIDQAAERFARDHFPTLAKKSAERYATSWKAIEPTLGKKRLDDVGTREIAEFVATRRREGVTDRTIRRDLMLLSSIYSQCSVWEWTERNPVSAYMKKQPKKRGLKAKERRTRYLSREEEGRLGAAIELYLQRPGSQGHEREMASAAILMSIDQGLRLGELVALRLTDVDFAANEIVVRSEDDGAFKSEPRRIPMFPRTRRLLQALPMAAHDGRLFWHGSGLPYHKFTTAFTNILKLAEIDGLRWHDLRRTCGCRLLQDKRWAMKEVSQFLGHSSTEITEAHYAFLNVEHLHAAMARSEAAQ